MDQGIFETSVDAIVPEVHEDVGYTDEDYEEDALYNDMDSDEDSRSTEELPTLYQQSDNLSPAVDFKPLDIPEDQRSIGIDYNDRPPIFQQANELDPDTAYNERAAKISGDMGFADIPTMYPEVGELHVESEVGEPELDDDIGDSNIPGSANKEQEHVSSDDTVNKTDTRHSDEILREEHQNDPVDNVEIISEEIVQDSKSNEDYKAESKVRDDLDLQNNDITEDVPEETGLNGSGVNHHSITDDKISPGLSNAANTSLGDVIMNTAEVEMTRDSQLDTGINYGFMGTSVSIHETPTYAPSDIFKSEKRSVKKYRANMTTKKCLLCGLAVLVGLAVIGVAVFCIIYFLGPSSGEVETPVGTVRGTVVEAYQGLQVEQYLGIPFAEPPVGDLRYSDPVPIDKLPQDPYEATSLQFTCLGYIDTTFGDFAGSAMWNAPNPLSEDCLYLNVWVPKHRDKLSKTPVMVWIYGGGFFSGSNALEVYDGKVLAAYTKMIVVSFNYRVGTFGYLSTGRDGRIKGNFGMKDQVLALQWIQDNIASFGGDPDAVTIFGESSGASSAGLHMMSDHSKDLFQRAIFESGSPDSHWSFMTEAQAEDRSQKFFTAVNCTQSDADELMACLRALDASTIMEQEWVDWRFMVFPWAPSVDGDFLVDTPYNLLTQGKFQKKDALLGVNRDEGTYWILYAVPGLSKDGPSPLNYTMFRDGVDIIDWDLSEQTREEIKTMYSPDNRSDVFANRDSLDKVCGDRSFTCPTKELTRIYTDAGIKTYFYYLTYRASNEVWPPWMGVIHGAEIQWVFGVPVNEDKGYTSEEKEFAKTIMSYWSNFAQTGDPNGDGLPVWPQYTATDREMIEFRDVPDEFYVRTELRDQYCAKWMDINTRINTNQPV